MSLFLPIASLLIRGLPQGRGARDLAGWKPLAMRGRGTYELDLCLALPPWMMFLEKPWVSPRIPLKHKEAMVKTQWKVSDRKGLTVLKFLCSVVRWSCKSLMLLEVTKCTWAVGSGVEGWELLGQPLCNYEPWERSYGIHILKRFFFEQKNLQ